MNNTFYVAPKEHGKPCCGSQSHYSTSDFTYHLRIVRREDWQDDVEGFDAGPECHWQISCKIKTA